MSNCSLLYTAIHFIQKRKTRDSSQTSPVQDPPDDPDEEDDSPETDLPDHDPPPSEDPDDEEVLAEDIEEEEEDTSLYPPFPLPNHPKGTLHLTAPPDPLPLFQHR
jgi:hypothetical protein